MFEIGQLTRLPLGYVGENGTRTISIDMKAWLDEYPGALIMVQVIRPVDHYKYPAAYTKTDGVIHWTVDGSEVMYAGKGLAQIALYNPDTKQEYKSRVVGTIVAESLDGFNDILLEETDPASKWVNQVLEAAESAEASKNDAANSKNAAEDAINIVAMQKNEAMIAIQNEGMAQVASVNGAGSNQVQIIVAKGEETLASIPEDYTILSNNVATLTKDIARNTAPPIVPTATGNVVTITDGAERPAAEVISHIEPVQSGSGDPSPSNVRPISGWNSAEVYAAGKNMLGAAQFVSRQVYPSDAIAGTDRITFTSPAIGNIGRFSGMIIPVGVGSTVTFGMKEIVSNGNTIVNLYYEFLDASPEYAYNGGTNFTTARYFTATATKPWLIINLWWEADANNSVAMVEPQLEIGSKPTAFDTIKEAKSLTATLPETVYGGDVYWLTGVLENYGHKLVIDGTNIAVAKHESANGVYVIYNIGAYGHPLPAAGGMIACSHFPAGEVNANNVHVSPNNNGTLYLGSIPGINDAAAYNAWLANNPITCVYRVADPKKIQLTPQQLDTLKGINNVWSNTGETTLSYVADTKLYIDQKLAAIAAATL